MKMYGLPNLKTAFLLDLKLFFSFFFKNNYGKIF